jgi:hypothetical protein
MVNTCSRKSEQDGEKKEDGGWVEVVEMEGIGSTNINNFSVLSWMDYYRLPPLARKMSLDGTNGGRQIFPQTAVPMGY